MMLTIDAVVLMNLDEAWALDSLTTDIVGILESNQS